MSLEKAKELVYWMQMLEDLSEKDTNHRKFSIHFIQQDGDKEKEFGFTDNLHPEIKDLLLVTVRQYVLERIDLIKKELMDDNDG